MLEIHRDRTVDFVPDEFVVATAHRDLVMRHLPGRAARVRAEDADLGLAIVQLADLPAVLAEVRRQREAAGAPAPTPELDGPEPLPLDQLLAELRALFGHRYARWTPTMGKNRVMRGVHFYPYPDAGGSGLPVALPDGTQPDACTATGTAGSDARVIVLDTSFYPHPGLAGRYVADRSALLPAASQPVQWWLGHATFIAGVIAGRAPGATIEADSVLTANRAHADVWSVAQRLVRCAGSGADVVNLSFGCFTDDGRPPLVLERAISRVAPSTVIVAAAGNYGDSTEQLPSARTPIWPAAFPDVVAVGAVDSDGVRASFNPRVPWLTLLAPGVDVVSTYLQGKVTLDNDQIETFHGAARWSGTSFAAAAVTGAIAARVERRGRTAQEALDELRRGGTDISTP